MSRPYKLVPRLILLLAAVLLCMALAGPAGGSENIAMALIEGTVTNLTVHEGLPPKFTIDGDLSEWTQPPSFTLDTRNQVARSSKVRSAEDRSARLWIAIAAEGLAIAGEVIDGRVHFPEPGKNITADHVELWLAFPEALMPPLAFADQHGEKEFPDATACDNFYLPDVCRKWVTDQAERRLWLKRVFVRQYLLSPEGIERARATSQLGSRNLPPDLRQEDIPPGLRQEDILSRPACCVASQSVFRAFDRGYRFEASIAPEDFPASGQVRLSNLKLLVDLIYADDGIEKTVLSSSAVRQVGHTETFNPVTLKQPLSWESDPPLMESLDGMERLFFFPGRPVAAAYIFKNVPVGYQDKPESPSPSVIKLPLNALPRVAVLGDIEVYRAPFAAPERPSGIGEALWSFRGSKPLSKFMFGEGEIVGHAERPPGLHFFLWSTTKLRPLATGTCGGCPERSFQVVSMDAAGRFRGILSEWIMETDSGQHDETGEVLWIEGVEFFAGKTLSRFCFTGYRGLLAEAHQAAKWVLFERCWRWDAGSESYVGASRQSTPK